jgi:hypothetical protein
MNHSLIHLTRELLSRGVFNHLPDNDVARLHWMILEDQTSRATPSLETILGFWAKGDFYREYVPPNLLQHCNEWLQAMGRPLIEDFCLDQMEC